MFKLTFLTLALSCILSFAWATKSEAYTVHCTNCSDKWTQNVERVTNLEQLSNLINIYREAIEQTQQQIALVQNNIKQYENMLQNTKNLPSQMLNEMQGKFSELAQLTNNLSLQKGDYMAMGQVFDEIYPGLDLIKSMAGGDGDISIEELWYKWSAESDRAAQATFQLTGSQLKDLTENSGALDQHINNLLATPEGQMEAIQAGNSLAAVQIAELRELRLLMATNIQATTQMAMQDGKRNQLSEQQLRDLLDSSEFSKQYEDYK
ncbi:MAG: P-type conjugative transfer protein TrbJ [Candidatus Adiutrix sp.]